MTPDGMTESATPAFPRSLTRWPQRFTTCLTTWLGSVILWPMGNVLRLLRLFALLRLGSLFFAGLLVWWLGGLPEGYLWLAVLTLTPIVFVFLPGLPRRLPPGRYLAAALFLFITAQSIEITLSSSSLIWQSFLEQAGEEVWPALFAWRGESFFYLLVPVVLAAWAFGRRGMLWSATWAALTYILGGLWLWASDGTLPLGYLTTLPPKLVILYIVPFGVAHLATAQRRQHEELKAAHAQLQRQAALTEQLATSRERNRLARELHDTLAHSLSGLSVQLQAADVLFGDDPAAARQTLQQARRTVRSGLDEARRAIAALRASPLEDLGLAEALHRRLDALGERSGLETDWAVTGDLTGLNSAIEQTVYRVADEALLNAERHAAARKLAVQLARDDGRVTLTVHDDGHGFDPDRAPEPGPGHFGLAGMRERTELLGGELRIESRPGQGTTVRLTIGE